MASEIVIMSASGDIEDPDSEVETYILGIDGNAISKSYLKTMIPISSYVSLMRGDRDTARHVRVMVDAAGGKALPIVVLAGGDPMWVVLWNSALDKL